MEGGREVGSGYSVEVKLSCRKKETGPDTTLPCPVSNSCSRQDSYSRSEISSSDGKQYIFLNLMLYTLPKRDEVTGEWRKLHNVELSDLYSLPNIVRVVKSRRVRWAGQVARMGKGRGVHRVLVGKPDVKRPLGRPRRRWEDNIKMDLEGVVGTGWSWLRIGTGGGHL